MKLTLDTNILLDFFAGQPEFFQNAQNLMIMRAFGDAELFVSANSFTDAFYILKKYMSPQKLQDSFVDSLAFVNICSLDRDDIKAACELAWTDFEDALMTVCAKKVAVDYIVTRDSRLKPAGIPLCTPTQIIEMMRERGLTYTTVDLD